MMTRERPRKGTRGAADVDPTGGRTASDGQDRRAPSFIPHSPLCSPPSHTPASLPLGKRDPPRLLSSPLLSSSPPHAPLPRESEKLGPALPWPEPPRALSEAL
ncbi:unnamed protein product [Urochloa humidicola]